MAIIKCKMCGGDLNIQDGVSVAECEYCGSRQTVPASDSEKKLIQFDRAERLRKNCEFDKAASLYEAIVTEFRQEAEAYWGLVLCKYGIEYVDDPATGKKIPTCHRSSFESVMDDTDLEQALENADTVARKVYRDEAKQIEEIRKGIIEVSGKEAPYDIFICYKETAEDGQRTIDSVIAQDVYDALTVKGYRVFFARISLEDKLGQEYEPYIFAALNSAKIMLAFGTDYEYYNAVWVKNEWSRFLKLMEKDKSKYLIPCYKSIDAYDMPKEFAKLQAQDMGKIGATQDLMRGIEKLLPKQEKPVTVVQEKVVVGSSDNHKITSLLDRGNMALEDGDWAKADSFFEEVLNNDSKNAQAYLGKTLAMERCRTMYAFVRKRKSASQNAIGQQLSLDADQNHIEKQAKQFSLPGYVEQDAIRKLYTFDLNYHSTVSDRKRQYREEEKYWAEHKLLSRAEKFASGVVTEKLAAEKKALFNALDDRIKKAQADEKTAKDAVLERYAQHLKKADEQAEVRYKDALARREKDYQRLVQIANNSANIQDLRGAAGQLEQLGDYQDSKNLAMRCRKQADEIVAKQAEEEARQKILRQKQEMAQKAKQKKISMISAIVVVVIASIALMIRFVVIPNNNYHNAVVLMDAGKYEEAIAAFEALEGYKDSTDKIDECNTAILDGKYNDALALMGACEYTEAIAAFEALEGYKDSAAKIDECNTAILDGKYNDALALMGAGEYTEAIAAFEALEGYKESATKISECNTAIRDGKYNDAIALMDAGEYTAAISAFEAIKGFKDSTTKISECNTAILDGKYNDAIALMDAGNIVDAYDALILLGEYKDSDDKANSIYDKYKIEKLKRAKVGDYVTFGAYEQDNNTSNGKEAIEWRVLDVKDGKVLVISKYALDCKKYDTKYIAENVTWQNCALRKWLNNDFLKAAFSAGEKAMIPTVTVSADEHPDAWWVKPGNATKDQVFLPSVMEVNNYFGSNGTTRCKATDYAVACGADIDSDTGYCWWWLRTPDSSVGFTASISPYTNFAGNSLSSTYVDDEDVAVRPTLWIDLNF